MLSVRELKRGQVLPIDQHLAGRWPVDAEQEAEKCCLAKSTRADYSIGCPWLYLQVEVLQDGFLTMRKSDVLELNPTTLELKLFRPLLYLFLSIKHVI